ncbi:MAG: lytic murein transglycosylase, partial [Desulfuromonadales bacterium]|nr:lytic murein transglycosylase [Desulfuromonadales bacterium]
PKADITASLIMPDGPDGPAFLVYDNFRAILKWNRSDYFALTAGYLADRIAGKNTVMLP